MPSRRGALGDGAGRVNLAQAKQGTDSINAVSALATSVPAASTPAVGTCYQACYHREISSRKMANFHGAFAQSGAFTDFIASVSSAQLAQRDPGGAFEGGFHSSALNQEQALRGFLCEHRWSIGKSDLLDRSSTLSQEFMLGSFPDRVYRNPNFIH